MADIIIKCDYKLTNGEWITFPIDVKDYFDDKDSNIEESIFERSPKFFLEPHRYLNCKKEEIQFLNFKIKDNRGNSIYDKFSFWLNGKNEVEEYIEFKENIISYRTITQSIFLDDNNYIIIRLEEIDGQLSPLTTVIMDSQKDEILANLPR